MERIRTHLFPPKTFKDEKKAKTWLGGSKVAFENP
jgi:hypothetical protein